MADDGKMAALKTATQGLLTQLQGAVNIAGDVYVSIIPFVKDVNIGGANWNSDWIYWGSLAQDPSQTDNTSWEALNGVCSNTTYNNNRNNCFTRGGTCSNNSFTASEHLHHKRHVQRRQRHVAEHLQRARHLHDLGQHDTKLVHFCRNLQPFELHVPEHLPKCGNVHHLGQDYAEYLSERSQVFCRHLEYPKSVHKS